MTEQIALWFESLFPSETSRELIAFIVSLFPVLECRGGMIIALAAGVEFLKAFVICYIGNMLPIHFILLFIKKIFAFMKKHGILNSEISRVLSYLGHTDCICIGDCGLPIPDEVERIDLALAFGEPTFMRTLEIVAGDMKVEKIVLAEEIKTQNPQVLEQVLALFAQQGVEVEYVSHAQLKEQTRDCKAVIRTGEITPYANIILQAGCIFA